MKQVPWIIIIVLLVLLFLQRECSPKCKNAPTQIEYQYKVDTLFDSLPVYITQTHFVPKYHFIYDTIVKHDTAYIVQDYSTMRIYSDTLHTDSDFTAIITDSIYRNELVGRQFVHYNLRETVINQPIEKVKLRNQLYIGMDVGGNATTFDALVSATFITKRQHLYVYRYSPFEKRHFVGFGYCLFGRTNKTHR